MLYTLNKEEYQELKERGNTGRDFALVAARDLILKHSGFLCIHSKGSHDYCDECPISTLSKEIVGAGSNYSRLICRLDREYSK